MKKTNYLYGVDPSKYKDRQVSLAEEKIDDAKKLLKTMRKKCDACNDPFSLAGVHNRVDAINKAIRFNEDLIAEAKGENV